MLMLLSAGVCICVYVRFFVPDLGPNHLQMLSADIERTL